MIEFFPIEWRDIEQQDFYLSCKHPFSS
jgi:hypothetical protein